MINILIMVLLNKGYGTKLHIDALNDLKRHLFIENHLKLEIFLVIHITKK